MINLKIYLTNFAPQLVLQCAMMKKTPCLALCVLMLCASSRAAILRGTVLQADGKAAAAAQLACFQWDEDAPVFDEEKPLFCVRGKADVSGKFVLNVPDLSSEKTSSYLPTIVAWQSSASPAFAQISNSTDLIYLRLAAPVSTRVRVKDSNGQPVVNAFVRPTFLVEDGPDWMENKSIPRLPATLSRILGTKTDAKGETRSVFAFKQGVNAFFIEAPGFHAEDFDNWKKTPVLDVTLQRRAALHGTIKSDAPFDFKNTKVQAHFKGDWSRGAMLADVDENGNFAFEDAPLGAVKFTIYSESTQENQLFSEVSVTMREGENQNVILPAKIVKTALVSGRVMHDDGTLAANVRVGAYQQNAQLFRRVATTDANGRYQFFASPDSYVLQFEKAPRGWARQWEGDRLVIKVSDATPKIAPDLTLLRAHDVAVRVVNDKGASAAGAQVHLMPKKGIYFSDFARSDVNGNAVFHDVPSNTPFSVEARDAAHFALPKKQPQGTTQVTLSLKSGGAKLKVRLVDEAGKTIDNAQGKLSIARHLERREKPISFDKNGIATMGALWPDAKYILSAAAPAHDSATTAEWQAAPGQNKTVFLTLRGRSSVATGIVFDAQKHPVSGARLWAVEMETEPSKTALNAAESQANGAFVLNNLSAAALILLAEKNGVIGGAVWQGKAVSIMLGAAPALPTYNVRPFAVKWLSKAIALDPKNYQLFDLLARFDGDLAWKLAKTKASRDAVIAARGADSYYEKHNLQRAMAQWNGIQSAALRAGVLLSAAEYAAVSYPADAPHFFAAALAATRAMTTPAQKARYLARLGELFKDYQRVGGDDLLREAAKIATNIGIARPDDEARIAVAHSLVSLNENAARALLNPLLESEKKKYALRNLEDKSPSLRRLARNDLQAAYMLAMKEKRDNNRAAKLLWLARASLHRNAAFSAKCACETARLAMQTPEQMDWNEIEVRAMLLADCATLGRRLKLPEAPQWAWRALQVRGRFSEFSTDKTQGFFHHDVFLILALQDSYLGVAREWFSVVKPRLNQQKLDFNSFANLLLPAAALPFDASLAETSMTNTPREQLSFRLKEFGPLLAGSITKQTALDEIAFLPFLMDEE